MDDQTSVDDEAAAAAVTRTRSPSKWLVIDMDGEVIKEEAHNARAAIEATGWTGNLSVFPLRPGFDELPLRFKVEEQTVTTTEITPL